MTPQGWFTLAVVGSMVLLLALEVLAPDAILFGALALLMAAGIITPAEAVEGFANKGMLTVAILFIVAYAVQSSGLLGSLNEKIMGRERKVRPALGRMMVPVVAMSAFMNNTPVVAIFIPAIRDWAKKRKLSPSKFLLPLSYASIFGGICTLIGTSTNLVVNGMYQESTGVSFSMFELAYIGIPCALAGMAFLLIFGEKLLPETDAALEEFESSGREYLFEMMIPNQSRLDGMSVNEAGLRNLEDVFLAKVERMGETLFPVSPTDRLREGDRLFFTGQADTALALGKIEGLMPGHSSKQTQSAVENGNGHIIEVVVSRSFSLLGKTLKEGGFRARYGAVVLAVHRHGENINTRLGQVQLRPGDTLLLLADGDFSKKWIRSREFYMLSVVSEIAPAMGKQKKMLALGALAGMVLLNTFGIFDLLTSAALAATFLLATKTITPIEARRSLEINVLVVIACALGISTALTKTGVADIIAVGLVEIGRELGPRGVLLAVYIATSVLTETVTNNAAAALAFPIAMSAAAAAGIDPKPLAITVAVAASASFATPIGYQTNLMVYGPGGYRFGDYLKIGIPLNLIFMALTTLLVPFIWPL